MRYNEAVYPRKWPKTHSQKLFISLFRIISSVKKERDIAIGDSNTRLIKFGTGQGTLGSWMPGKHIKVGHIEAIPEAEDIGPYRNIVIHTGVNSINNPRYRKSNLALIKILESKIKNIYKLYPRANIFISLLLPSRSVPLNHRIRDLIA